MKPARWLPIILLACAAPASALQVTLLGPTPFTRAKGAPTPQTVTFPGLPTGAMLLLTNGTPRNRVSSATITLNGNVILGPNAFNQNVAGLTLPLTLQAHNRLTVELRSAPGGFLIATVWQEVPASAAAVIGPEGGILEVRDPRSLVDGVNN